jgi:TetR/AcrR family transcriptional repressor of lmrAB and yxaGH operons
MSTEMKSPLHQKCKSIYADWCAALQANLLSYGVRRRDATSLSINMLNAFQGALLHARIAASCGPIEQAALLLQRETQQLVNQ